MRIALWIGLAGVAVVLLAAALGLALAHRHIRGIEPELPQAGELAVLERAADPPVRLSIVDTAAQVMPRSAVIDPSLDPDPDAAYAMSHAAFVLEWADGRILLIDAGMDAEAAADFGAPLELAAGAEPIIPLRSLADALGPRVADVAGIGFTHLHTDHTQGIGPLCDAREGAPILVLQTPLQMDERNYTTRPGHAQIEAASCSDPVRLEGGPLYRLPGFPGVGVLTAAGHTPGSQVFAASVASGGERTLWLFVGDVVNHAAALIHDLPKPYAYSLLVVPESRERLGRVRRWAGRVADATGARALVSHDLHQLESMGLPVFAAASP